MKESDLHHSNSDFEEENCYKRKIMNYAHAFGFGKCTALKNVQMLGTVYSFLKVIAHIQSIV